MMIIRAAKTPSDLLIKRINSPCGILYSPKQFHRCHWLMFARGTCFRPHSVTRKLAVVFPHGRQIISACDDGSPSWLSKMPQLVPGIQASAQVDRKSDVEERS